MSTIKHRIRQDKISLTGKIILVPIGAYKWLTQQSIRKKMSRGAVIEGLIGYYKRRNGDGQQ